MQRTLFSLVLPLIICCQNTSPDQAVTGVLNNLHYMLRRPGDLNILICLRMMRSFSVQISVNAGKRMPFKNMVWLALKLVKAGPTI